MNIVTVIIMLSLLEELPELPETSRQNRRANRDLAIARNHRLYISRWGRGHWTENASEDGNFHSYHSGHVHSNDQNGRWEDYNFGGHRRLRKWSRDYYPSLTDEKARHRWTDELKDYFAK